MHVTLRHSLLPAVLLLAGMPYASAQWFLPDPIAPAVIGRPLSEIRRALRGHEKPVRAKDTQHKHEKHAAPHAMSTRLAPAAVPTQHVAKRALDDRVDPRVRVDDVGQGTHFARKPLGTGVYIGDSHRDAVRKYFAQHPAPAMAATWKIGEPLPTGEPVSALPAGLVADLPRIPPGYRYVQLRGDVVMIASESRLVVDGVSRTER